MKALNITTLVGCPNMCVYCPQDAYMSNYKGDVTLLTLDKFKLLLKNVNNDIILNFAGFSENFFNPHFVGMMIHAHRLGYKIALYTTLRGFNETKLNELKRNTVNFQLVHFHEYVGIGFNKKTYDKNVQLFLDNIEVYEYRNERIITPFSRAGNNDGYLIPYKMGKISCCFATNDLIYYENTLIPNGDLYLCCMDFGLKHKIGNLFDHNYDSQEFIDERNRINELRLLEDSDLLCRKCEFSIPL